MFYIVTGVLIIVALLAGFGLTLHTDREDKHKKM